MSLAAIFLSTLLLSVVIFAQPWPRWEERTIDCTSKPGDCILKAEGRDPAKYRCRHEPMPHEPWNTLAINSTQRIACPIGCEPTPGLSVLVKKPSQNHLCQKYYTYGKYRDNDYGDWFLWMTEPCLANVTTWCQFNDVFPDAAPIRSQ